MRQNSSTAKSISALGSLPWATSSASTSQVPVQHLKPRDRSRQGTEGLCRAHDCVAHFGCRYLAAPRTDGYFFVFARNASKSASFVYRTCPPLISIDRTGCWPVFGFRAWSSFFFRKLRPPCYQNKGPVTVHGRKHLFLGSCGSVMRYASGILAKHVVRQFAHGQLLHACIM